MTALETPDDAERERLARQLEAAADHWRAVVAAKRRAPVQFSHELRAIAAAAALYETAARQLRDMAVRLDVALRDNAYLRTELNRALRGASGCDGGAPPAKTAAVTVADGDAAVRGDRPSRRSAETLRWNRLQTASRSRLDEFLAAPPKPR